MDRMFAGAARHFEHKATFRQFLAQHGKDRLAVALRRWRGLAQIAAHPAVMPASILMQAPWNDLPAGLASSAIMSATSATSTMPRSPM